MTKEFTEPEWLDDDAPKPVTRKQKVALDITLAMALPFCFWAGWFEFQRAQEGNWRAWVYSFEWPFFGLVAMWLWRRLRRGDMPKIPRPKLPDSPE